MCGILKPRVLEALPYLLFSLEIKVNKYSLRHKPMVLLVSIQRPCLPFLLFANVTPVREGVSCDLSKPTLSNKLPHESFKFVKSKRNQKFRFSSHRPPLKCLIDTHG